MSAMQAIIVKDVVWRPVGGPPEDLSHGDDGDDSLPNPISLGASTLPLIPSQPPGELSRSRS